MMYEVSELHPEVYFYPAGNLQELLVRKGVGMDLWEGTGGGGETGKWASRTDG